MQRRQILATLSALAATAFFAPGTAFAATMAEQIVSQLRAQGFAKIVVETTWLGRTRILAERRDLNREIILNPASGEILRDLWLSKSGTALQGGRISDDFDDNSGHGGGGGGGTGDEDDDEEDDDSDAHGGGDDDDDDD